MSFSVAFVRLHVRGLHRTIELTLKRASSNVIFAKLQSLKTASVCLWFGIPHARSQPTLGQGQGAATLAALVETRDKRGLAGDAISLVFLIWPWMLVG